jgi:type IV pilus assembly protein PilW
MKNSSVKSSARKYSVKRHINMHNSSRSLKQQGYTMLEVLVAMSLGLVVLGSAIGMQISHREAFSLTESKLNMQTNAKFAHEFIAASLRELGAVGCRTVEGYYAGSQEAASSNYEIAFNNPDIAFANFKINQELLGYENAEGSSSWSPGVSGDFSFGADMLDGSDALTIRGAIGPTYRVDYGDIDSDSVQLNMSNISNVQLKPNHYAVLSQCDKAEVFKITGTEAQVNAGTIFHGSGALGDDNALPAFEKDFTDTSSAELRRVAVTTYYIAENDNGIPTLYRDIDNVSDPLVEGVERMQIEYGINTDPSSVNVPDEYHDAQWVETQGVWGDVVSVRLSFIMRSKTQLYKQNVAKTYSLPGAVTYNYAANDRFARIVYTATVNLRNRTTGVRL